MTEPDRFRDTQEVLSDFADEYLVVCPQCGGCAWVRPLAKPPGTVIKSPTRTARSPWRVTCPTCSYTQNWQGNSITVGSPVDSYFQLPLWFQTDVGDHRLWAYNLRHLQFIKAFVRATIREGSRTGTVGTRNRSVVSRLPEWVKTAKNRKRILKALDRMEQRAPKP